MIIKQINLNVAYDKLKLDAPEEAVSFTGYILQNTAEYCADRTRPAVIICPGGGYRFTSDREATPIALGFIAKGITCFVLRYSVAPNRFPTSLLELASAVKMVRDNAQEWNIAPNQIVVCGFSAGGHLAASLGVFWNSHILADVATSAEEFKPNALILCYPVITAGDKAHNGSIQNLLGEEHLEEQRDLVSLEKHVTADLPPTFLWHTYKDQAVPVENALLFANEATAHRIPLELHIYPNGGHGLSLATDLVNKSVENIPTVASWLCFAVTFIKNLK
ncbi:alpha/beta hydrolase [Candidatus Epulonipiscium viviparus]|uniref:alpha/beta hydrolase n=1 Tax=Candidatus Epulonipiscium viviparus TaxID=420336 RepID=UPI0027380650|nr:alpha/beta hydrolase [Candidatus Epulopiscium viviparus]